MYDSLILEGGGIKGLAYVGALRYFDETGILKDIKNVSGTSAGSQIATLVASGFTYDEIRDIVQKTPFYKFSDSSFGFIRDVFRLFTKYGYCKGDFMEKYMNDILYEKWNIERITFKELFEKTKIHLRLTGTCVTSRKLEWFDHVETPYMEVARAVRISSCIPLYFAPVKYNDKYYVDGGCLRNLPVDAFPNSKSIVLDFVGNVDDKKINSLYSFISAILDTVLNNIHMPDIKDCLRVEIPTGSVSATDFNISDNDRKFLLYSGYNSVKKALT